MRRSKEQDAYKQFFKSSETDSTASGQQEHQERQQERKMIYAERPKRPFWVTVNPAPRSRRTQARRVPSLQQTHVSCEVSKHLSPQSVTDREKPGKPGGIAFPLRTSGRARRGMFCHPRLLPSSSPTLFLRFLFNTLVYLQTKGNPNLRNWKRVLCRKSPKVLAFDNTLLLSVRERGKCYHLKAPGQGSP